MTRSQPTTGRVSVIDAAMIRALVNCAAGLEYESAMADAHTLATTVEGRPRMRYVGDANTILPAEAPGSEPTISKKRKPLGKSGNLKVHLS